ncbi:MAG: hypothetical protein AB1746_01500 [Candidatus Zixiibacteriota bacterium]
MKAVILNSRQGIRPVGNDSWVINTQKAVRHAVSRNCTTLTSIGMKTWEIVLYLTSCHKANIKIYLPVERGQAVESIRDDILRQYRLETLICDWEIVEQNESDDNILPPLRDMAIIYEADILYPISIRPGGNLEKLIHESCENGKEIINEFMVEYQDMGHRCRMNIDRSRVDNRIDDYLQDYIIHWTKASNTAWPGESMYDYYHAVVNSDSAYPRDGLQTLQKILTDQKLIASSRHYRKEYPAVAFSSLLPGEAVDLMKWRARYHEMTIEPYGVAIHKDYAETLGIKKVFYGNAEMLEYLEEENRPYFQNIGTKGFWMPEKEYRRIGAVDLAFVPSDRMAVIVWKPEEIDRIHKIYNGRIFSLYK